MNEKIAERFARETAGHQMTVLHDDGLYRHLHFRNPKSGIYWFDLTTVPGALIFQGDGDSFVFRRIEDMFEFFRSPVGQINPQYWAEKLTSGHDQVMKYDQELLAAHVKDAIQQYYEDGTIPDGLDDAVRSEVLDEFIGDESLDRDVVERFRYWASPDDEFKVPRPDPDFAFGETWEWNCRDYDWWFLWACHGIVWGIAQYDKARSVTAEPPVTGEAAPQPTPKPGRRKKSAKLTRQPAKRNRERIDSVARPGPALTNATHLDGRPVADVHLPEFEETANA